LIHIFKRKKRKEKKRKKKTNLKHTHAHRTPNSLSCTQALTLYGPEIWAKKIEANEASDLGAMGSFYKITYHTYKK
jgi:hypothetical protein